MYIYLRYSLYFSKTTSTSLTSLSLRWSESDLSAAPPTPSPRASWSLHHHKTFYVFYAFYAWWFISRSRGPLHKVRRGPARNELQRCPYSSSWRCTCSEDPLLRKIKFDLINAPCIERIERIEQVLSLSYWVTVTATEYLFEQHLVREGGQLRTQEW
jgi:hypothetical protein